MPLSAPLAEEAVEPIAIGGGFHGVYFGRDGLYHAQVHHRTVGRFALLVLHEEREVRHVSAAAMHQAWSYRAQHDLLSILGLSDAHFGCSHL